MLLTLLPVLLLALLLLGLSLSNSYRVAAETALFERLQLQQRLLLADVEPAGSAGVKFPEIASEPALNQVESGRFAVVYASSGTLFWRSISAQASSVDWRAQLAPLLQRMQRRPQGELLLDAGYGYYFAARRVAFALDAIETEAGMAVAAATARTPVATVDSNQDSEQLSDTYTLIVMDDGSALAAQQDSYTSSLIKWLCLALALLASFQLLLMFWSFKPLASLVDELKRVENGDQKTFEKKYPTEIAPLTENLNRFVEGERSQRERYKNSLADLAHSLKTPLAALQAAVQNNGSDSALLEPVERMDSIIRYQLQRAQPLASHSMAAQHSNLQQVAEPLLRTLQKVYHQKPVALRCKLPAQLAVAVGEHELLELLGNLLDNAFKYCRQSVLLSASAEGANCIICIEDDGPGIPAQRIPEVLARGGRLDEQRPGQGIGLAVAAGIVEARGGSLEIERASDGGARVVVSLPVAVT
ncbi:MAG: hypothetical protein HKO84_03235 [Pseudomonadales bacterium]|nr:hypothetical protein [Pseudomonadales bacterium]